MAQTTQLEYAVCQTALGWLAVAASPTGLVKLVLPKATAEEAVSLLDINTGEATESNTRFASLKRQLQDYFLGQPAEFLDELDLSAGTPFDQVVWLATRGIPFGCTQSYGWVARQIGKPRAYRAVGRALSRNPLPVIIPCHRVLAADGSLHGFAGGLELKRELLQLEGIAAQS
jgi:methylated-DNA-[protein]-cysteine S-methyltransferase